MEGDGRASTMKVVKRRLSGQKGGRSESVIGSANYDRTTSRRESAGAKDKATDGRKKEKSYGEHYPGKRGEGGVVTEGV